MADPAAPSSCPAARPCPSVPSSETAYRFMQADPAALPLVFRDFALRTTILGVAMFIFGERDLARLLRNALAGATGIEGAVFTWVKATTPAPNPPPPALVAPPAAV